MKYEDVSSGYSNLSVTKNVKGKNKRGVKKAHAHQPQLSESGAPVVLKKKHVEGISIYVDGACQPNPGTGGYGFVVVENDKLLYEFCMKVEDTTNNRMEMMAISDALQWIQVKHPGEKVTIYTDSEYCHQGITKWHHGWVKKGWVDVKNTDLWKGLVALKENCPQVEYKWVRGHNGNKWNEHVDKLAVSAITGKREEDKPIAHEKKAEDITNGWNSPKAQQVLKDQIKEVSERRAKDDEEYAKWANEELKRQIDKARQVGMAQGLCIAIAHLLKEGYNSIATDIWRAAGLSIAECERLEVDSYDLDVIKQYRNELK